ncbi:50S ribosomal protein L18 [Candidatus Bathyarchaeota archaeon]|nr:50S ribosomal protein L18 [Candidatus Bathyarchaeota archaeon]
MARGPGYTVPYRRRREGKTNYRARRILATSDRPRFVVRPTNRNIIIQLIEARIEGDHVLTQTTSHELVKRFGWLGGRKNTPAAYLLGMIAGYKALERGIKSAILDIGLKRATKGCKIFAAVKGARDAGLDIPCDPEVFPSDERIEGAVIAEYAKMLLENPEEYERRFSDYLRRGLRPEELPKHFKEIKERILEEMGGER